MLIMRSETLQMMEGINISNQKKKRTIRKKGYLQLLENLWDSHHQTRENDFKKDLKRVFPENEKTSGN